MLRFLLHCQNTKLILSVPLYRVYPEHKGRLDILGLVEWRWVALRCRLVQFAPKTLKDFRSRMVDFWLTVRLCVNGRRLAQVDQFNSLWKNLDSVKHSWWTVENATSRIAKPVWACLCKSAWCGQSTKNGFILLAHKSTLMVSYRLLSSLSISCHSAVYICRMSYLQHFANHCFSLL